MFIVFTIIILTDVSKELEIQMNYWKEKQQEIESHFKNLCKPSHPRKVLKGSKPSQPSKVLKGSKPSQPSKVLKGSKSKKVDFSNKQLSCYAASLTKEFLTKVTLSAFSFNFTLQCCMLYCQHWTKFLNRL